MRSYPIKSSHIMLYFFLIVSYASVRATWVRKRSEAATLRRCETVWAGFSHLHGVATLRRCQTVWRKFRVLANFATLHYCDIVRAAARIFAMSQRCVAGTLRACGGLLASSRCHVTATLPPCGAPEGCSHLRGVTNLTYDAVHRARS